MLSYCLCYPIVMAYVPNTLIMCSVSEQNHLLVLTARIAEEGEFVVLC